MLSQSEMEAAYRRLEPGAARWARAYSSRLSPGLQMPEDYAQEARIGVWLGLTRYDPALGAKLETFTYTKARGAVAEARRQWDARPRSVQEAGKVHLAAGDPLPPALDLPISLEGAVSWDGELLGLAEAVPSDLEPPEEQVLRRQLVERLWNAIARLPERQQLVLVQRYVEGRTFRQISHLLGRSESRAHQLHDRALARLRLLLVE